ncbi:hypothetical protein TGAM01_v202958 [Trichoderma gamsii]|uniref:Uncharacterized protein n=1 Tax=Trichoderma gamsii TaxID=398673 RepID=A0A2P4ZVY8_9HYPO|nr:hypothetical protein TGAM01_v202958 [Trichoderma gamsii]PON28464.1 hypothetical protein TGAM01_v202958 [Trichoderma gamsii]
MPEYSYTNSSNPFKNPPASLMGYMWMASIPDALNEGNMNTTIGNGNKVQQTAKTGVNCNKLCGNENDITQSASKDMKRRSGIKRLFGKAGML